MFHIKAFLIFQTLCLATPPLLAESVSSFSAPETYIKIHKTSDSTSQLETCTENECTLIPDVESLNLNGFYFEGTDQDWEDFFTHCSSYESLNRLYRVTKTVSLILLAWHPATIASQSAAAAQATNFVAGKTFQMLGNAVPFFIKYSVRFWGPTQVSEYTNYSTPYPEVSADSAAATEFATKLIFDGQSSYTTPNVILDYINVLRSCSSVYLERKIEASVRQQFDYYISSRYQPNCSTCHEQKEERPQPEESENVDIEFLFEDILLPYQRRDIDVEQIQTYLESLESL